MINELIEEISMKERMLVERCRNLGEYDKIEIKKTNGEVIYTMTKNERFSLDTKKR